jgi:hypothetical protein
MPVTARTPQYHALRITATARMLLLNPSGTELGTLA